MVNPPKPGDPSFELYSRECADELASLKRRAKVVSGAFASLPGMSCQPTEGGMYSFPQLLLPDAAVEAARAAGKAPDVFYCLSLLEEAGISTVPGSGFGQAVGTAHFRTTILPREDVVAEFVDKVRCCFVGCVVLGAWGKCRRRRRRGERGDGGDQPTKHKPALSSPQQNNLTHNERNSSRRSTSTSWPSTAA